MSWTIAEKKHYDTCYAKALVLIRESRNLLLSSGRQLNNSFTGGGESDGTKEDISAIRANARTLETLYNAIAYSKIDFKWENYEKKMDQKTNSVPPG